MHQSQLEIRVPRAADTGRLLGFFKRTAYEAEQVGERTVALTPPRETPTPSSRAARS
jgi:hypothetical protein